MAMKQDYVFVIGHKNPDTDSICSAIAYAEPGPDGSTCLPGVISRKKQLSPKLMESYEA